MMLHQFGYILCVVVTTARCHMEAPGTPTPSNQGNDAPQDGEQIHFDPQGTHYGEFDRDVLSGSRHAFENVSPEAAKERLGKLYNEMDANNDAKVDPSELLTWLVKSFRKLDEEAAREKVTEFDENQDGAVTFKEYLAKAFGYNESDLLHPVHQDPDTKHLIVMLHEDRIRFNTADLNHDGKLNVSEYSAFLHPHNYAHMAHHEVEKTSKEYDKNKDGFVSQSEFIAHDHHQDNSTVQEELEHFAILDKNKDGKLDKVEMQSWVSPGIEAAAQKESDHLFRVCDADKDGKLTKAEVLDNHSLWMTMRATDYGRHMQDEL